jgi:hypothetical protein
MSKPGRSLKPAPLWHRLVAALLLGTWGAFIGWHQFAQYPALARWAPLGAALGILWFGALGFFGVAVVQQHSR